MDLNHSDVEKRLTHYPPSGQVTVDAHVLVRDLSKAYGKVLMDLLPAGREKSLVLTSLEETMFWANAAIARNGGPAQHIGLTEINEIREDYDIRYPGTDRDDVGR